MRADPRHFTSAVVLNIGMASSPMVGALFIRWVVNDVANGHDGRVSLYAICAGIAVALGFVFERASVNQLMPLIEATAGLFERKTLQLSAEMPGVGHLENPEYRDKLEQIRFQPRALGVGGPIITTAAVSGVVRVAFLVALFTALDPILLTLPVVAALNGWVLIRAQRRNGRMFNETSPHRRQSMHFFELATSPRRADEVRTLQIRHDLVTRHDRAWHHAHHRMRRTESISALQTTASGLVFAAAYSGAVAIVLDRGIRGLASPGDVVLTVVLASLLSKQLSEILDRISRVTWSLVVVDRFLWLVDYSADQARPVASLPTPLRLESGIELRNVGFQYPGTQRDILRGIQLTIPKGSTLAIVGDNGAGKTTLVKLLTGMYLPTEGEILIDGAPIAQMDLLNWRRMTSAAFQDFAQFELSLQHSVAVGDLPYLEDGRRATEALNRAGAASLPGSLLHGLDTALGASLNGIQLSGGQWQKVALGRAMMRPTPLLLVFDEPTASLDPEAEQELFTRWSKQARHTSKTSGGITILISHRFSTVRMADYIAVLDGTGIREFGTHPELVAENGLYAELYRLQVSGFHG